MIKHKTTYLVFILLLLAAGCAQSTLFNNKKWQTGPEYKIEHIVRPGKESGKAEVEVRLSLPYDEILFVKNQEMYKGRFEISIMMFRGEEQCINESWIEVLSLNEFRFTNSRKRAFELVKHYTLEPADYRLELMITDLKTQYRRKQVKQIEMQHLKEGNWMLGDIYIAEGKGKNENPGTAPDIIYIGFSAAGAEGEYPFNYTVFEGEKAVKHGRFNIDLISKRHEYIFPVSTKDLGYNQYTLLMQAEVEGKKYERSLPIRLSWSGSSELIPNLGEAIEQMRYLSHTGYFPMRQYRKILNAGQEEQRSFFTETWKSIDPTPDTERNELMDEYYYRIQMANRRFSSQREGWRTDRGMIYVIYGEPDAIEAHHMEINTKPYIIWYYYTINRSFVFVDYTGFGDYQLSEPLGEY